MAGNVVNAACQLGVLSVLAHLASAEAVGQYVYGLSITAPIMAIAMLQLRNLLVTDADGEFAFADYFGARVLSTTAGFVVIVVVVLVLYVFFDLDPITAVIVLLVGVTKCADSLSDVVRGLFQRLERMNYSGTSLMLRGPTALGAMSLTLWLTHRLPVAIAVMAAVWFTTFLWYDLRHAVNLLRHQAVASLGERWAPRFHLASLWKLTCLAFPLGVTMSIISLQTNLPRYFVKGYGGEAALGYFGAIAYPMVAATMVATSMGQAASPRLARYFIESIDAYTRLLGKLVVIAMGLGLASIIGVWALGKWLLTVAFGAEYAQHQGAFMVLAVAISVQLVATCGGYALTAARYLRIQVALVGCSCLITAIASAILIPRYGVLGGALAVLCTTCSSLVLFFSTTWWAVRSQRRLGPERRKQADIAVDAGGPDAGTAEVGVRS